MSLGGFRSDASAVFPHAIGVEPEYATTGSVVSRIRKRRTGGFVATCTAVEVAVVDTQAHNGVASVGRAVVGPASVTIVTPYVTGFVGTTFECSSVEVAIVDTKCEHMKSVTGSPTIGPLFFDTVGVDAETQRASVWRAVDRTGKVENTESETSTAGRIVFRRDITDDVSHIGIGIDRGSEGELSGAEVQRR